MGWKDLDRDLAEMFGEFTEHEHELLVAHGRRSAWLREYHREWCARRRQDPVYRAKEQAANRERDRVRRAEDAVYVAQRLEQQRRYYQRRVDADPEYYRRKYAYEKERLRKLAEAESAAGRVPTLAERRAKFNAKARERYANDPVYRAKMQAKARKRKAQSAS